MVHALLLGLGLLATPLNLQDKAPDFEAADCDGQVQVLSKLLTQGPVILAFFPKAFTSGCTKELAAFARAAPQIKAHGAQLVAISADRPEVLKKFRTQLAADYLFIPDADAHLMRLYEAKAPLISLARRTTFVIDRAGKIVHIDRGTGAVKVQAALDALDSLGAGGL